jgi:Phage tail protein (Tail_P2_I)
MSNGRPQPGSFAEALYASLQPLAYADSTYQWSLLNYLGAIGQMLQKQDYLSHSPDGKLPIWYNIVNIETITDDGLPWLGQMCGVRVNEALTPDQQRQQIRDHIGWGRGRPDVLEKSIQVYLTGTKTVDLQERTPDPYSFTISTYADETASYYLYGQLLRDNPLYSDVYNNYTVYSEIYDSQDTRDYIMQTLLSQKPAGLVMNYTILPGSPAPELYSDLYNRGETYGSIYTKFQTYADIR